MFRAKPAPSSIEMEKPRHTALYLAILDYFKTKSAEHKNIVLQLIPDGADTANKSVQEIFRKIEWKDSLITELEKLVGNAKLSGIVRFNLCMLFYDKYDNYSETIKDGYTKNYYRRTADFYCFKAYEIFIQGEINIGSKLEGWAKLSLAIIAPITESDKNSIFSIHCRGIFSANTPAPAQDSKQVHADEVLPSPRSLHGPVFFPRRYGCF